MCNSGTYWSTSACVACPAGSGTLGIGATSVSNCTCIPGYVNTEPSNPAACEPCGVGFFCTGLSHREACPASQTTQGETSMNASQCLCQPGTFWADNSCFACPAGQYKSEIGNLSCTKCPKGRWSSAIGAVDPWKCTDCMADATTAEVGAESQEDCACLPGLYDVNGSCQVCGKGFYCPGTGEAIKCTSGATSFRRSTSASDCLCQAGHYSVNGSKCNLCPRGFYKQVQGNEPSCPLSCPTNGDSEEGARSPSDCFCLPGHYAEVDPETGVLARCTSCAIYTNLICHGGRHLDHNQTDTADMPSSVSSHVLPVAKPGFFQTGKVIAEKCTAVLADGSSPCLGGKSCGVSQVAPSTPSVCNKFLIYENQCAEGSTGMLCGECPALWARQSLRSPCQQCITGTFTLILLVFADVMLKASINCA
eukprot:Skav233184  [mRNA]  locus=scaffold24:201013:202275:+ [translate_table: standard]